MPHNLRTGPDTCIDNDHLYTQADNNGAPILFVLANYGTAVLGAANISINQT